MPKILHIMPKEKFSKGFIEFTYEAFPEYDISFFLYGDEVVGYSEPAFLNVYSYPEKNAILFDRNARSIIRESDLVILNWCNWSLACALAPIRSKLLLMFWGGDVYKLANGEERLTVAMDARKKLARMAAKHSIRHAQGIITLTPGDLDVVETLSPRHGEWYLGCVPCDTSAQAARLRSEAIRACMGPKPDAPLRILLGNSATSSNRHGEALEMLRRFSNENLQVYAPLSYGDAAYRNQIIAQGHDCLGEKFVPIIDFMDRESYRQFLSTISIGVFNHNRQQGMGNINALMQMGAKVYLAPDNVMWNDFANQGRVFFDTNQIGSIEYEEFVRYSAHNIKQNFDLLDPVKEHDEFVARWAAIYKLGIRQ